MLLEGDLLFLFPSLYMYSNIQRASLWLLEITRMDINLAP